MHPDLLARIMKFDTERPAAEYAVHLDAWANGLTGIGTDRDKVTATVFQNANQMLPSQLEDLYHNDDMAARICDLLPKTALRKGWLVKDPAVQLKMKKLGAPRMFRKAAIMGRLHGGGPIILGGTGASTEPLTTGVTSMLLVDRWTLAPWEFYTDTNDPKYGQVKIYRVMRPSLFGPGNNAPPPDPTEMIHESRVILFPGAETSPRRRVANGHWDDSVLQRVYQVVQAYGITWASITHLLQDAAQGVYAMKDLWNLIVSGNKAAVEERMRTVDEQRSVSRAILIDADQEKFSRVPTPFSGIPELIDRISERVASASEYPLTVLMGSSPAGMNATGKSDLEIFYGRCEHWLEDVCTPAVETLAEAMGITEDIGITYPPLWLPSAEEISKTRYATAQADNIYHEMGVPAEILVKSRFRKTGWSPDTDIPEGTKIVPPAALGLPPPHAAGGLTPGLNGDDPRDRVGEGAGTAIGTHHFSPKYGR